MIQITLPDNSRREFPGPVSVAEVAQSIGPGLAKMTVAGKVDGRLVDASDVIDHDARLQIITPKDEEGLEIIRHSTAHLVGHAVKQLYPTAKMVIGPVIYEGFYYDISYERPFTPDDMAAIESRMRELIAQDYDVVKKMTPRAQVIEVFTSRGEDYKLRLVEEMPDEQAMEQYMRKVYRDTGYQEVKGPQILDKGLWEKTGHWQNYRENMFTTESEKREYALKPMNCPGHVLIFKHGIKSYRDLPIRFGEFGQCHRNEPSGALHGIMRVRGFTQDDGHAFVTEDHILEECVAYTAKLQQVYTDFGFTDILYKVATRPENRVGSDALWDKAEHACMEALRRSGVEFVVSPGDGAFYGPKIEYTLKDALGRQWQCGTMQVDFNTAERLGAEYVTETSGRAHPVMLHRAIVGSLERFIGMLIEHHAGALPAWLAPVQAIVLNITEHQQEYAQEIAKSLRNQGLRIETDLRNEKITYKIREHSLQKPPYLLVVGDKEMAAGAVAVRARGNKDLGVMSLEAFAKVLSEDVAGKR